MLRSKIYIHNLILFLILSNILFSSEYPYFNKPAKQLEFERNKITYSEEKYDYNYSIETLYQLCNAYNRTLYKEIKNSRW